MQKAVSIQDRDISKTEWNTYLKKYKSKYKLFRDEIGTWSFKCNYGFIQPYSVVNKQLVAVLTYKSAKGINILLKKLQREGDVDFRITQRGDFEVSIAFSEKDLSKFTELLGIRAKKQISEERRKILAEQLKKARKKRRNKK